VSDLERSVLPRAERPPWPVKRGAVQVYWPESNDQPMFKVSEWVRAAELDAVIATLQAARAEL
jgi:hypothetical protein